MTDMSIRVAVDLGGGREFHYERDWPVGPQNDVLRPYMASHELSRAQQAFVRWFEKEYGIDG